MDLITLALAKKFSSDAADAWLSEHVDPETGYVLDDTLTLDNAAAPAGTVGEELNELKGTVEDLLDTKANIDGYYESMTVGNAEQLVATVGVEDSVPFNFRTTGGSADVGDRKTMEVVGGTIAWNQCLTASSKFDVYGGTATTNTFDSNTNTQTIKFADGEGTKRLSSYYGFYSPGQLSKFVGHKILFSCYLKADTADVYKFGEQLYGADTSFIPTAFKQYCRIRSVPSDAGAFFCNVSTTATSDIPNVYIKDVMLFDLTQMFGATIADYIYSLEQANAGAGVAWFRNLFPKPYYAYNAGELMSVKTSAYKTVGFNQWDEEWEIGSISPSDGSNIASDTNIRSKNYIPVLPGTTYYFKGVSGISTAFRFYDINKDFVGTGSVVGGATTTIPQSACYMRFVLFPQYGTTYNHDICMNLHWDGERDGEYEPYEAHTYPLDSDLELRGIPKLDADNQLYYDGDIYESDGTVARKYGIVNDVGALTWNKHSGGYFYSSDLYGIAKATGNNNINSIGLQNRSDGGEADSLYIGWNGTIYSFYSSAETASDFKAAMSGVQLVYELATPTTETADPFQTPQIVNDFGTEEFVDVRTIPIPAGHNSKYQANLRAKLEMAPNSPSGDGDYIVRQSGGQNTYVPITFPADELPAAPTTDGNYVLKCTVSSGTATFTWEAQT